MHKPFSFFTAAKAVSAAALCVALGGCSDTTAPATARNSAFRTTAVRDESLPAPTPVAVFVIGDNEAINIGASVNFWGAQWWKHNHMSGVVSAGRPAFKGYAITSDNVCGGTWQSLPGNSSNPPETLGADVLVIVTSTLIKDGTAISGDIKKMVMVHQDGGYGPNPGHDGNGVVITVVCGGVEIS
jgi:hypothetical protein